MIDTQKTLSIIVPFYNEEPNILKIYGEIKDIFQKKLSHYDREILFMDNHSDDTSFAIASQLSQKDPTIKVIRLSRNFGYQASILTGFSLCTGDAAIQLDADGEDDPALIPTLVDHWEKGYNVVYGIRRARKENFILHFQRKLFYRILKAFSSIPIPVDAGDFRLLDRKVLHSLNKFKEVNPYIRGLIAYTGFNQTGVAYDRRPRYDGKSKFGYLDYWSMALDGLTAFSRKPLAIVSWLGFALAFASFLGALFYIWFHFIVGTRLPGFTTLILVHLFLAGIQLLCFGMMGAYIARIFDEVKRRPLSIIEAVVMNGELKDAQQV